MRLATTLFIVLFFARCGNRTIYPPLSNLGAEEKPDTSKPVITTSSTAAAYPTIFEASFDNSTSVFEDSTTINFYTYEMGKLNISSGKIIASDPITVHDALPFKQAFPTGEFPVQLAMAKFKNDERVAFSRILFSNGSVAKWEVALQDGQEPISIKDSNVYCFGVDAGEGLFIDSIANKYFNEKKIYNNHDAFLTAESNFRGHIYKVDGYSLADFSTGFGDGCYATYIGRDKQGNVCQLLTDFGLVGWWKLEEK
jgi:hypothetical protein